MEALVRLRERYNNMCKAQVSFDNELKIFEEYNDPYHKLHKSMRNSVIKTFELAIDPFWKFLRDYIAYEYGITLENPGPKMVYREAERLGIILEEELPLFIDMVEDRNETVHIYKELIAQAIVADLPGYCQVMGDVLERIRLK